MKLLLILLIVSLLACSLGFKKFVWFISIGYGLAIAALAAALLVMFHANITAMTLAVCIFLILYGCRLSGYLAYRELKTTYNKKLAKDIKKTKDVSMVEMLLIWISSAILYVAEIAPLAFRLKNNSADDAFIVIGLIVSIIGLCLESIADAQKNAAKKINVNRFVDTGLFRIVRCPNYFGEMLIWTGVLISGISSLQGAGQWILSILGYIGIIFVMFSGARRLEIRQNRVYGADPEYQAYVKKTPILIPLVPIYSVEKYKWLVA